jgi:hypothetical protein
MPCVLLLCREVSTPNAVAESDPIIDAGVEQVIARSMHIRTTSVAVSVQRRVARPQGSQLVRPAVVIRPR